MWMDCSGSLRLSNSVRSLWRILRFAAKGAGFKSSTLAFLEAIEVVRLTPENTPTQTKGRIGGGRRPENHPSKN